MNNLMILREDMKFLYYNGYSWPHPFTQCVLQNRLKLIRYNSPPVDNSICNQYLRVPDNKQVCSFHNYRFNGFILFFSFIILEWWWGFCGLLQATWCVPECWRYWPQSWILSGYRYLKLKIVKHNRLILVFDLDYEYRRNNMINRNRLQGTPLYLPWMPGII